MVTVFKFMIKLLLIPLYIPVYLLWAAVGGLLGGRHRVYDMWRWD